MNTIIEQSDHSGLVTISIDSEGRWQAHFVSRVHARAGLDALALAASEATALLQLKILTSPGSAFATIAQERMTSTFERILSASHDIDLEASAIKRDRLRQSRGDADLATTEGASPIIASVSPVSVTARDGVIVSVSFEESANNMTGGQLEQALGLALTEAVRKSVTAAARTHDSRMDKMLRDTIVYQEGSNTP